MRKSPFHLYNLKEAAELLGGKVSVDTLRAEIADGHLQCVRMREDSSTAPVLFTAQQLLDWVEIASDRGTPHTTREKKKPTTKHLTRAGRAAKAAKKKAAKKTPKKAPRKPAKAKKPAKATKKPKGKKAKRSHTPNAVKNWLKKVRTRPSIDSQSERRADLAAENPPPVNTEPASD